jgi:ribosome biogenesis GTPase / thiamine phosphate phosphatase
METSRLRGRIVRAQSGFFAVQTDQGKIVSKLRGRLKQKKRDTDVLALGDMVSISLLEDGGGMIEEVEDRLRVLSRQAPGREREQVIVANPDQMVVIMACADPDPNFRMLDRILVVAERENIPALICANKVDLVHRRDAEKAFSDYRKLDYPIFWTSAISGKGVGKLHKALINKLSVFVGPSGVGKSSLMNSIQPNLGLRTKEISMATGKGTHTTVYPELLELKEGGYVADTPGLKAFGLWDIEAEELDAYFREISPLVQDCEFSDCMHVHEPGCAVLAAVERGDISAYRYDSYLRIRDGDDDDRS